MSRAPTAKKQEPRAKAQQPGDTSQEPRAKSQEARAKKQGPSTIKHEPRAGPGNSPSRQETPDQPPWRAGPPHHEEYASSMHNMQGSVFARNARNVTRYLPQKNFRSECIALFAGCESPRYAIVIAGTPARRNVQHGVHRH